MSHVSAPDPQEFDFWEFVNCGICHLEFVKDTGALSSVPFWLTSCGHVVCNSHISESPADCFAPRAGYRPPFLFEGPDQTCGECGSPDTQLMPLAREVRRPLYFRPRFRTHVRQMEPPIANWFQSVPTAFDAVGYTLRVRYRRSVAG